MADDLKPCPFCNAEMQFEKSGYEHPYSDTCPLDSLYIEDGHVAAWNSRATPTVQEAAKVLLAGLGDFERDRSHPSFEAAFRGYADSNKPAPFNRIGDGLIAALRAIAGESHD